MSLETNLSEALDDIRLQNARLINRIRLVTLCVFSVASLITYFGFGDKNWRATLVGGLIYLIFAALIWLAGEKNQRALVLSRFSIPVVDIPLVTAIQYIGLSGAEIPGHTSEFTISIFICLLMLSALTMSPSQTYLALGLGIVGEQILQHAAGIGWGGRLVGLIMMVLAMWICRYAVKNRMKLISAVTAAETKRRRLQRYFSPGVGELLESHSGSELEEGKDCELTVVFTDIRGFSTMSEKLESREIVALLNEFHGRMVEALFQYGGTLDKYTGDGILAYFNAPIDQPDHAERAIRCALSMQRELAAMNAELPKTLPHQLEMGIGIHSGRATVGEIGAPSRREYTAIGDTVNVAARVQQLSNDRGIRVLVSESTASHVPSDLKAEALGEFRVKGRKGELALYSVSEE